MISSIFTQTGVTTHKDPVLLSEADSPYKIKSTRLGHRMKGEGETDEILIHIDGPRESHFTVGIRKPGTR